MFTGTTFTRSVSKEEGYHINSGKRITYKRNNKRLWYFFYFNRIWGEATTCI